MTGRGGRGGIAILLGAIVASMAFASASTAALPVYDGLLFFPTIHGSSDPEEYSWQVELQPGQELKQIDGQQAAVYYEDGTQAEVIRAESAHDAGGSTVPTSLAVSAGDIVTLMVLHRAGDPAAGGAPFAYPVVPGPGYEIGSSTVEVRSPWPEAKPEGVTTPVAPVAPSCVVPKLLGRSLKADRRRLKRAGCRLGEVGRVGGATAKNGRVIRQSPKQGAVLALGAAVEVTLGPQAKHG